MAAPHPCPLGILRPELPRLRTARLPRCPLQAILRQVLVKGAGLAAAASGGPARTAAGMESRRTAAGPSAGRVHTFHHSRRQRFANAAVAASRKTSTPIPAPGVAGPVSRAASAVSPPLVKTMGIVDVAAWRSSPPARRCQARAYSGKGLHDDF